MKLFLLILGLIVVAGSLIADYKWRQWMANRTGRESRLPGHGHEQSNDHFRNP